MRIKSLYAGFGLRKCCEHCSYGVSVSSELVNNLSVSYCLIFSQTLIIGRSVYGVRNGKI